MSVRDVSALFCRHQGPLEAWGQESDKSGCALKNEMGEGDSKSRKTNCMCPQSRSHIHLSATPWTVALQAPLSMGFSRQEHWRGLPFPSPEDLTNPGIEPKSLALQVDS